MEVVLGYTEVAGESGAVDAELGDEEPAAEVDLSVPPACSGQSDAEEPEGSAAESEASVPVLVTVPGKRPSSQLFARPPLYSMCFLRVLARPTIFIMYYLFPGQHAN